MFNFIFVWATLIFWIVFYIFKKFYIKNHKKFHFNQKNIFESGFFWLNYETSGWNDYFNSYFQDLESSILDHKFYSRYFEASVWFTLIVLPYVFYVFLSKFSSFQFFYIFLNVFSIFRTSFSCHFLDFHCK